ncbi:hypothetical protein BSZ19_47000 [Bradyrhizobium japonicum]|uniref:Uncharacterized protein n=1 Tax=Bradyrhizobium japonicum TaxID=375 RepID=A0A1Y2J7P4_BRAJP|nr:hypothetical protein BSZ19_47000 [Bradyrhizobium japonicum]
MMGCAIQTVTCPLKKWTPIVAGIGAVAIIAAEDTPYHAATVLMSIPGMDYAIPTAWCRLSFSKVVDTTDINPPT